MKCWKSLSHVRWDCKYHLVFISKYGHRTIYGEVRKKIGGIVRSLCRQKGIELTDGAAFLSGPTISAIFRVIRNSDTHAVSQLLAKLNTA